MARTWWSIQVDLVGGAHAHDLWPRPGRILLARPGMTFRMLADSINDAFARWDRAHLHAFTLTDGNRITMRTRWDEPDDEALDDTRETLSRLSPGDQFAFEFDFGDSWMHLCTVAEQKVDPVQVYGIVPDRPVAYFGWGDLPDQYGRRWDGDDGSSPDPPQPDPPLSDLPDLHYTWGSRAFRMAPPPGGAGTVIPGPWAGDAATTSAAAAPTPPWSSSELRELRGAVRRGDGAVVVELLLPRDALAVAHHAAPALLHAVDIEDDPAATALVVGLMDQLAERGGLGDDELIDQFERALLQGNGSELRPVPVELGELAMHLEGPTDLEEGWKLEVATGQLWPLDPVGMAGLDEPDDFDDPGSFVTVVGLGSSLGYSDMQDFIATVTDEAVAERLRVAIDGKGAFRRFKDIVHDEEALWQAWSLHSSERWLARARWWLAEAGFRPAVFGR